MLSFECIYLEYSDAIREGDGDRVLHCFKYLRPMFITSGRKNYLIEFFHTIANHSFVLSPHLSEELLWSRFINVHGIPGHNIPIDLHMEHLNWLVKESIRDLGANKTQRSFERVGGALGTVSPVLANFDKDNEVTSESSMHKEAGICKDMNMLISELLEYEVFKEHGELYTCPVSKAKGYSSSNY